MCVVEYEISFLYATKLKLQAVFQKKNQIFTFVFEHQQLCMELLKLLPLKLHPTTLLERQTNVPMPFWQSNGLGIMFYRQFILVQYLPSICWKLLRFLEGICFSFLWF